MAKAVGWIAMLWLTCGTPSATAIRHEPVRVACALADRAVLAHVSRAERDCCKVCRKGKACGDTCIARDRSCQEPPGCACDL